MSRTADADPSGYLARIGAMAHRAVITGEPHWNHPSVADLYLPPRDAHPVFFGAFDWHSAVHGHWTLARLISMGGADPATEQFLTASLARRPLLREVATLASGVLDDFEIPYGLAWELMLDRALADAGLDEAHAALGPLSTFARRRLGEWLGSLEHPDEHGLHRNTAFTLGLIRDAGEPLWFDAIDRVRRWWMNGSGTILEDEPGPFDFLSPTLESVAVTLSALEPDERLPWFEDALPDAVERISALQPVECPDLTDGRVSHLLGLNLARSSALRAIAGMVDGPPLVSALSAAAERHLGEGLKALDHDHFAVTHWIATFALRAFPDLPNG